jgi:hypothetical protein
MDVEIRSEVEGVTLIDAEGAHSNKFENTTLTAAGKRDDKA